MSDVTRLPVTLVHKPAENDGPSWCWSTEYGSGQSASPNAAVAAAYRDRATKLKAEGEACQSRAADCAEAAALFADVARKVTK